MCIEISCLSTFTLGFQITFVIAPFKKKQPKGCFFVDLRLTLIFKNILL